MSYYILKLLGIDYPTIIANTPKFIGAIVPAIFDIYLLKLVELMLGNKFMKIALIINYSNIYSMKYFGKGFVNNFEMTVFTVAFYY
jgi:hypothetical protein